MRKTLDHIRQEIGTLPAAEEFSLWRAPGHDLNALDGGEATAAGAALEAGIESRLEGIRSGTVEAVPGVEFERRTRTLFGELGIKREPRNVQDA